MRGRGAYARDGRDIRLEILDAFLETELGRMLATAAISMIPVVELRGGIPFGILQGLDPLKAYLSAVIGNMVPVPLIVVHIRQIFRWLRRRSPWLGGLVDRLERKAHLKGRTVLRYRYLGLFLFVAVPLPGTGGWTGALVAAFLDMRLRSALPSILLGLMTAGILVLLLTHSVTLALF